MCSQTHCSCRGSRGCSSTLIWRKKIEKNTGNFLNRIRHNYFFSSINDTFTAPSRNTEGSTGEALPSMLIFLVGKTSPTWHLVPCSVPQLASQSLSGCRSWQDSWVLGLLCSQLQENSSAVMGLCQWCHLAPKLAWHSCLSTQARLRFSSPAGKSCHCPCLTGRGLQPYNHSCATAAWNCKPTRTHQLLWAAPVSTYWFPAQTAQETLREGELHITLGEKNWGTKMPEHVGWLCLLAAAPPQLLSLTCWVTWLVGRLLSRYSPGQVNYRPWYQAPN